MDGIDGIPPVLDGAPVRIENAEVERGIAYIE